MKDRPTTLFLLRHGETVNTADGRFRYNGQTDIDVTDRGMVQLKLQAERLKTRPITSVYSSGLTRSVRGAETLAGAVGAGVHHDERLKEIHAGRWETLTVDEVQARFPGEFEARFGDLVNFRIPGGGENLLDVQERAISALSEIIERHRGEEIAIVGHGGVNRIILCTAAGIDLSNLLCIEQDFGCLNIINYWNGAAVVKLLNQEPYSQTE